MESFKKKIPGILMCFAVAVPAWFLGKKFPVIGGPVFGLLIGMVLALLYRTKDVLDPGLSFVSQKILQAAVVFLGFGLNLNVVLETGRQSLPIIVCTISTSLIIAYVMMKVLHIDGNTATLIGVGSSICGGSAIAATAPVIHASDEEVSRSISTIFLFNAIAAVLFPAMGQMLGFSTTSGESFGIFAGTAVNDTSSVTAAASTWDSMWGLGTQTLDKAVTVKLTRTLAIIPITLVLAFYRSRKNGKESGGSGVQAGKVFPMFILWFIVASVVTTISVHFGADSSFFSPLKELSKFMIVLAMAAIGQNTNVVQLVKKGGKPILLGACCWAGITCVSLLLQHVMGLL